MPTQTIVPNIWCNRTAEEAARLYADALPDTTWSVAARYPTDDLPDFQRDLAGLPVTVDVVVGDYRFTLVNADDHFAPNSSISFLLNFDPAAFGGEDAARARLDQTWAALADGEPLLALDEYPHSKRYGWLRDRFGMTWQLMLTDPAGDPRPFLTPLLMFSGAAQNRARAAIDAYTALFSDSAVGTLVPYPAASGPADAGAVMFADFQLAGQWLAAMDAGAPVDAPFTCGVSLEVRCPDQAEIDRLGRPLGRAGGRGLRVAGRRVRGQLADRPRRPRPAARPPRRLSAIDDDEEDRHRRLLTRTADPGTRTPAGIDRQRVTSSDNAPSTRSTSSDDVPSPKLRRTAPSG